MANVPLAFIDTETTGVHWRKQIWEAAIIRREPDGAESETSFFVDVDLRDADPFGLAVGRFYERHPFGRRLAGLDDGRPRPGEQTLSWREAALKIARWTHGAHIVGAVPNFDTVAFERLMRRRGLIPGWHYHLIDVENLAVGYLKGIGYAVSSPNEDLDRLPWDSDQLSTLLGVVSPTEEEKHTALGDARWAMRMYDAVMGES